MVLEGAPTGELLRKLPPCPGFVLRTLPPPPSNFAPGSGFGKVPLHICILCPGLSSEAHRHQAGPSRTHQLVEAAPPGPCRFHQLVEAAPSDAGAQAGLGCAYKDTMFLRLKMLGSTPVLSYTEGV
jgi:hypothetical protein